MDAAGGPRGNSEEIQWIIRSTEVKKKGTDDMESPRIVRLCVYDPRRDAYFVKRTLNNPTEKQVEEAERELNENIDKTVAVSTNHLKKNGEVVILNDYKPNRRQPGEKPPIPGIQIFPRDLVPIKDRLQPQTQSKPTLPSPGKIKVATNVAGEKKEIEQIKWALKANVKVLNRTPEELRARLELLEAYEYTRREFLDKHPGSTAQEIPFGSGVGAKMIPTGFPSKR